MNLGKYSANSFPTMQTGSGKPRLALTFDLTRQVEEDPMCLILRAEGGSFSCVAARPHQRVYRRGQDEPLPTSGVCDLSHLESCFTQCGRPCSALPAISNRRRKRMGRASEGAETCENLPQVVSAEGNDCFLGPTEITICAIPWAITVAVRGLVVHGDGAAMWRDQEGGNHRQQEGRNPTGFARNSCRYSLVGDSYDGCNV
jgi:hypothetical protein